MKEGFIAPPWPHKRGDSVRAEYLIERIEKEASLQSGLYYEIYEYRALSALNNILKALNATDKKTFIDTAAAYGFRLDAQTLAESSMAFRETMDQIWRDRV